MTLKEEIIADLTEMETELGDAYVTIDSIDYPVCASVFEIAKELEFGGYGIDKMMTVTIRLQDANANDTFTTVPTCQQILTYSVDGTDYRIISTKTHTTKAFIRLTCKQITRGI